MSNSVGKTSLMQRFVLDKFQTQYKATIGADFVSKDIYIDNRPISLQVLLCVGVDLGYSRAGTL